LNFNSCFPVFSLFNLKNGCDRIIYFTDNRNVYRSINLDDLSKYYDGVNFVCSRLNFSPTVKCPVLDVTEIKQSGGELLLGSYQFFIRYLDNDLNTTKWLTSTQPIIIIKDSLDIQYSEISGGKNLIDSTNQIGVFTPSSKAITIQLNNLDANFTYYQYAIVEKTSGNNTVSRVTLSNNIPITQSLYTYTGTNTTGTISIDDIIIDKLIVEKVKAHAQTDNRLFLSNLSDLKTYD
jgi:hypothetical protein